MNNFEKLDKLYKSLIELKEIEMTMDKSDNGMDKTIAFDYLIEKVQEVIKKFVECYSFTDHCSLCGTIDEVHQCNSCNNCYCIKCDKGEMMADKDNYTICYKCNIQSFKDRYKSRPEAKKLWLNQTIHCDEWGRPPSLADVPLTYMSRKESFKKLGYSKETINKVYEEKNNEM